MNLKEMRAFAQTIVDGGPAKKAEVATFMKAFLDANPDPMKVEVDGMVLPKLYFEIEKTDTGIHVPREANQSYSKREGYALVAMLVEALK